MTNNFRDAFTLGRRSFLLQAGFGLGSLTLGQLLGTMTSSAQSQVTKPANGLHFPARAKRVIYMHMLGALSQCDTFDYKPMLEKMHGEELPPSVRGTRRLSAMVAGQTSFPLVKPLGKFAQHGQSGAWVSDLLPYTAKVVDDLCFIKSVNSEQVNHDPASKYLHSGFHLAGRPSEGAWVNYALGSANDSLPTFVVLQSGSALGVSNDAGAYGAGFLPSQYQGVEFRAGDNPVPYVVNPNGVSAQDRKEMIDLISSLSKSQYNVSHDPEILSKASQYEMSYRMQTSVPDVADISKEPKHVLDLYGVDVMRPGTFAQQCLLARRLAERNVRFITLFNLGWDAHTGITNRLPMNCRGVDQGAAALVTDLKQHGLMEDTLVIFATEFGRTSFAQGTLTSSFGRDHHGGNFTFWLAGAGVKRGFTYGESDDFSYNVVKDPVSIHDFQATLLYILGIDHERLTFRYQGRDFRLTDVGGTVVKDILA